MKYMILSLAFTLCTMHLSANKFKTTSTGTLENGVYSIIIFHNHYGVGKQSGIEIIKTNERLASNGTIIVELQNGELLNNPLISNRRAHNDSTVLIDFEYPDHHIEFTLQIQANNNELLINVNPEHNKLTDVSNIYFEIDVYWGYYAGKTYFSDNDMGILPHNYLGGSYISNNKLNTRYITTGTAITMAADDKNYYLKLKSNNQTKLGLYDERYNHSIGWYTIRTISDNPSEEINLSINFPENNQPKNKPRIIFPEIGYHPAQPKDILLEYDRQVNNMRNCKLLKLHANGDEEVIQEGTPEYWGKYYRYHYYKFNFSNITTPGIYRFSYDNDASSNYFKIASDIYQHNVWQPTITQFMAVQMCHMRVIDRSHLWHNACHLDDGLQAPTDLDFFDGFRQNDKTETDFEPNTTIPGMNVGGWHDAGDDDINTGSNGINLYSLILAVEEFGLSVDETTIDFTNRNVIMNHPDGINDAIQQIIQGILWQLAPFENNNHSYAGVISSSFEQYLYTGDWASYSDNLLYDQNLPEDSATATHSGKLDDRYIFTNKDSKRNYFVAAILASAYRVLKTYDPELAQKCINTAKLIWQSENENEPVHYHNVGSPQNYTENQINASVELYLSTGEKKYLEHIQQQQKSVFDEFETLAWTISRVSDNIKDKKFTSEYTKQITNYANALSDSLAKSPFGTVDRNQVWGTGWEVLWSLYEQYYLIKKYPELFPEEYIFNGLHYQLGRHPGGNTSLVSGVGTKKPIPAFGINRDQMHYIVGGVFSGPAKILPDFIEMKEETPYIWQQTEYIISGAGPYIFLVLASEKFLNNQTK